MARNAPTSLFSPDPRQSSFSVEEALLDFGADSLDGVQEVIAEMDEVPDLKPEIVTSDVVSEEGIGTDIRNTIKDLFQYHVLAWKHFRDVQNDFFAQTNPKIARYNQKLNETLREYQAKKSSFKEGPHHLSLMELWYFFSNKNGPSRNIVRDLQLDTEFSKYVLVTYRKAVIDQINALANIYKGARLNSISDCHKVLESIERLKTVDELFDEKWCGDGRYFNVTSVEKVVSAPDRDLKIGDKTFTRIPQFAAKTSIVERKSKSHTAMKVIANVTSIGAAIKGASIAPMELTTSEIGDVIMFGKDYIDNLDAGVELTDKSADAIGSLARGFEHMQNSVRDDAIDAAELRKFVNAIGDVSQSYIRAIKQPFGAEVIRSIKGGKYCYYVGLRCIYNATRFI